MADFEKVYRIKFDTSQAKRRVKSLETATEKVGFKTVVATRKMTEFGKAGTKAMKNVQSQSDKASKRVQNLGRVTRRSGEMLKKFSRNFNRYVTLPIAAGAAASVKFAVDFNKGMANVASLIPGQAERIGELKKSILGLSVETGKSLEDLTGGLYETISAFGDTEDTVKNLTIATQASVAGLASTKESLSLLSAVTKGYGDTSAEAMQKASDLSFMTVKLGQTTFPELAASMGRVIPLAAAMNTKQEELFGAMATLTGVTGNAAEVSTQLASVYSALLKPTEKLTAFASKYGFESGAAMAKAKGLAETIRLMAEYTKGDEKALAKMLRRKEALIAVLALTGGQADTFNDKLSQMQNVTNATTEAFKAQTKGINKAGFSFEKTKRRLLTLAVRIGDKLLPIVERLLDRIEPLIKKFEDMDEEALDFYMTLGKWAVLLGVGSKLMVGLNSFSGMIAGMGGSTGTMAAASKGVVGLIGKVGILAQTFAAAFASGTALSELYIEPAAKKRHERTEKLSEADISAKSIAKTGTTEQVKKELSRVRALRKEQKRTAGQVSPGEIFGAIGAAVGLVDESPAERRRKAEVRSREAEEVLQSELKSRELEGYLRGGGSAEYQTTAPSNVNVTVNAPINAPGGDPVRIQKGIERSLSKGLERATKNVLVPAQ